MQAINLEIVMQKNAKTFAILEIILGVSIYNTGVFRYFI